MRVPAIALLVFCHLISLGFSPSLCCAKSLPIPDPRTIPGCPEPESLRLQKGFSLHAEQDEAAERYDLGNDRFLEVWRSHKNPMYRFLDRGRVVRSSPISPTAEITVELPATNEDGEWQESKVEQVSAPFIRGSVLMKLSSKSKSDVVICETYNGKYKYSIFSVSTGFPKLATLTAHCPASIEQLENEPVCKMVFEQFLPDFGAQVCAPHIVYGFKRGRLQIDTAAMSRWLPHRSEYKAIRKMLRSRFADAGGTGVYDTPVEMSDYVFQYYFAGRVNEARKFINFVWPRHRPGKRAYWRFVKDAAKRSGFVVSIQSETTSKSRGVRVSK